MKTMTFVAMALLLGILPAAAQTGEQAGSVAIAASIRSGHAPDELQDFAGCVNALTNVGASYKQASKDCKDYRKVLADESKRIANEAADATKASRPMIMGGWGYNGWGGGWGGYGYRGGFYPQRTVIVRQAPPPRPAAQARPAPPPRPAARVRPSTAPRPATPPRSVGSPRSSSRR